MIRRKMLVALALVALTVIATGAGVATIVKPAAAQGQTPYVIPVDGQSHVFTTMNNQSVNSSGPTATAVGNTITWDNTTQSGAPTLPGYLPGGAPTAALTGWLGISDQIQGSYTPTQLANIPATVTVKGTWTVTLTGSNVTADVVQVTTPASVQDLLAQTSEYTFLEGQASYVSNLGQPSVQGTVSANIHQQSGYATVTCPFSNTFGKGAYLSEGRSPPDLTAADLFPTNPSALGILFVVGAGSVVNPNSPLTIHASLQVTSIAVTLWPSTSTPTQLSMTPNVPLNPSDVALVGVNQKFSLSGTLQTQATTPVNLTGKPVYLEGSNDGGFSWAPISATTTTKTNGSYSFTGYITAAGTYWIRAHFNGQYPYQEAVSPVLAVQVGGGGTG